VYQELSLWDEQSLQKASSLSLGLAPETSLVWEAEEILGS
jgi:hypothetical protein